MNRTQSFVLGAVFAAMGSLAYGGEANAGPPYVFTYAGNLKKQGAAIDGQVQLWVWLSGSSIRRYRYGSENPQEQPPWSQRYQVSVNQGDFAIQLGEREDNPIPVDLFSEGGSVYLGVHVGEDVFPRDGGIDRWIYVGREKLAATPYAISADYASKSTGLSIESNVQYENFLNFEVPLSIRDGDGQFLRVDSDDIVSIGTLHLQRHPNNVESEFVTEIHGPLLVDGPLDASGDNAVAVDSGVQVSDSVFIEGAIRVDGPVDVGGLVLAEGYESLRVRRKTLHNFSLEGPSMQVFDMGPSDHRFCVLSASSRNSGGANCKVFLENPEDWPASNWKMEIEVPNEGQLSCTAMCIEY